MARIRPRQIISPISNIVNFGDAEIIERQFTGALAGFLGGLRSVIPIGRARAGIYILVKQTIARDRVEVVMSPYTIPDVVNMVIFAGGVPVFVDFLPGSTNVAVHAVDRAITPRTAAVLLTHYHVNQDHLAEIVRLCRSRSVPLFDDCAIAFGASYDGAPIGGHTDASVMSFSSYKLLNYFWGGAVAVRSDALFHSLAAEIQSWPRLSLYQYRRQATKTLIYGLATSRAIFPLFFRLRRPRAVSRKIEDVFPLARVETVSVDATITSRPHLNALKEWNAKFSTLPGRVVRRRSIASIYDLYLRNISVSAETSEARRKESCFVNYPVVVGIDRRDELYRAMLAAGFDVGLSLYPNAHEVDTLRNIAGDTKNVSNLVRSVLTLPTHARIELDYAHALARQLAEFLAFRRN